MERMFLNPETGEIHPESFYLQENINISSVIERVETDDAIGYLIKEEFIERYRVRSNLVFNLFLKTVMSMTLKMMSLPSDSKEERTEIKDAIVKIFTVMTRNICEMKEEEDQKVKNLLQ